MEITILFKRDDNNNPWLNEEKNNLSGEERYYVTILNSAVGMKPMAPSGLGNGSGAWPRLQTGVATEKS